MITRAPISPTARANARATPERMPGRMLGSTTRRKIVSSEAPSDRAASSISCRARAAPAAVRTTKGSVTKSRASTIAVRVNATLIDTGDCGP